MASRILGMGDVLTLIEKAQADIDEEQAKRIEQKMRKNEFDFEMYLESMSQMKKNGWIIQYPWNDARSWNGNGQRKDA